MELLVKLFAGWLVIIAGVGMLIQPKEWPFQRVGGVLLLVSYVVVWFI